MTDGQLLGLAYATEYTPSCGCLYLDLCLCDMPVHPSCGILLLAAGSVLADKAPHHPFHQGATSNLSGEPGALSSDWVRLGGTLTLLLAKDL